MEYTIDFMDVGNSDGDAVCIRYGNEWDGYRVAVIDGGYGDTGDSVIRHLQYYWNTNVINDLSLTHGDQDHAAGCIRIMDRCEVHHLRMNRPWDYVDELPFSAFHGNLGRQGYIAQSRRENDCLVQLERLAERNVGRTRIGPVLQGTSFGNFIVLAPSRRRFIDLVPYLKGPEAVNLPDSYARPFGRNVPDTGYESWEYESLQEFPTPPTTAANEASAVHLFQMANFYAVFTGDVGPQGLIDARHYADLLGLPRRPGLFQLPHQGSRHNVTPSSLDVCLGTQLPYGSGIVGWVACSVGTNKTSHPRRSVTNALMRRGYPTQVARGFVLRYSNVPSYGTQPAPTLPFFTCVEEEEVAA